MNKLIRDYNRWQKEKAIKEFLSEIGRKGGSQPKSDKGTESRREICRKAGLARQAKRREEAKSSLWPINKKDTVGRAIAEAMNRREEQAN